MIQSEEYPRCHRSHWTASSFYSRGTVPGPVKSLPVALRRYCLLPWQLRESTCYPHWTIQTSLPRPHDHSVLPVNERKKKNNLQRETESWISTLECHSAVARTGARQFGRVMLTFYSSSIEGLRGKVSKGTFTRQNNWVRTRQEKSTDIKILPV